jgi:hypothetical protein
MAALLLVIFVPAWAALSLAVVLGRVRYDRRRRRALPREIGEREARRLVRRATRHPRTDWGRWRRVTALTSLAHARHPGVSHLLRDVLDDPDPSIAAAAVRALGDLRDDESVEVLVGALREGRGPRSRIAAQLERLAPAPRERLVLLLDDPDPAVRFWGATLLAPYPGVGQERLVALAEDPDPNVRAAAVETLGSRGGSGAAAATLARLDDPVWFVRVHAARAAGQVAGASAAPAIARLFADARWWVRTAAKDALRAMGRDAVVALLPVLTDRDAFARNGAAEILQDIGFVDALALEQPDSPLLERIYAAGGERFREAAEQRTRGRKPARKVRAA